MKIVAFGHRKNVGKDTAANFAVSHVRANCRGVLTIKIGFATKIKDIAHDLYKWAGLQDEEYYEHHTELKDVVLKQLGKSPRQIWIEIGMSMRAVYPDTWLMYPLKQKCDYLFIKDLRFPNEASAILDLGGMVIKVDNPRIKPTDDEADSALAGWLHWSAVLINDSDMATLNKRVISLIPIRS